MRTRSNRVRAFCSQNSTAYEITAPLFVDASGDGIVGFLAGAAFRIGCGSARSEFGEQFAPAKARSELLGHTIYFYSKDTGRPVKFVPPSFALKDITKIPRWRDIKFNDSGCRFWWLEWGGKLDTIHDSEKIKWELWSVVYGVWNHIKNSGQFPEAETLTLEWVGTIPGKRESRRFEGDYMLTQQDIVEQRRHADAVSFGGWAIDLHPADGVYSAQPRLPAMAFQGRLSDSLSHDVFAQHHESVPRRPHHQRLPYRVRFDARDGDLRARRPGGRHGGGDVCAGAN